MAHIVTAREANQQFSRLLARAEAGAEVVITRRGRRVAALVPRRDELVRRLSAAQERALADSIAWARAARAPVLEEPIESPRDEWHRRG